MGRRTLGFALAAAAACALTRGALAVEIGDKAPELAVSEWVQGDPVKVADVAGGRTLLVVFWRTFTEDVVDEMDRLDKLAKDRKDKAFDVVAVTTEPADVVRTWLGAHKVGLRVGIDQFHAVEKAYARKEDKQLPISWLVDKAGVVVWKGSPDAAGHVVDEVLSGKFDLAKAKAARSREEELWTAYENSNWDALAKAADAALVDDPNHALAFDFRLTVFREKDDRDGYAGYMKAYVERAKDDAAALVRSANQLLTQPGETMHFRGWSGFFNFVNRRRSDADWRDVDLAYAAAKRAVETSKSADQSALACLVRVLTTVGLVEQAVEQQKKVVALDSKDEDEKKHLAFLQACVAARAKATAPPPPAPKKR
jgi:peroxiredoxin